MPSSFKEIDRYSADMARAKALRKNSSRSSSNTTTTLLSQQQVQTALDLLEESDQLQRAGELQQALDTSEQALGVLIKYLKQPTTSQENDTTTTNARSSISKDVLRSTVELSLSNAENIKQTLSQQRQQVTTRKTSSSRLYSTLAKLSITKSKSTESERSSNHDSSSPSKRNATISPTSLSSSSSSSSPLKSQSRQRRGTKQQQQQQFSQDDPLVQLVKTELYVDQSQLEAIHWQDIAGLAQAKQSLQEAAILPLLRPDLFTGLRRPQNILLYGPPGTGKTMLVKAVAKESQSILFVCTASSLTSKWHGEGEKLLRTLFQVARAAAPSILFVDEVDALLSARKSEGEHEASRRFKTEFMTQVDGIASGGGGTSSSSSGGAKEDAHLLLIACTNCPWDLDAAVMRRFPRRIYIDLPDLETRKELVNQLLQTAGKHSLTKRQIATIVKRLEGFSGSDISSIASEASFGPLRSLGSVQAIQSANANQIRPISFPDFEQAMDQATKSTSQDLLDKYEQWKQDQSG